LYDRLKSKYQNFIRILHLRQAADWYERVR